MNPKFTLLVVMILWITQPFHSSAQGYDTTQFNGRMKYIFANVNKTQITTGLLSDYGIEFFNLDNYTGAVLHDSNFVSLSEWRLLYASMLTSKINNTSGILNLDTTNRRINKYAYRNDPVTFAVLHYNYQSLRTDAVTAGLMTVSNGQLFDVANRTQSPYSTKEIFAAAPAKQAITTGTTSFVFRSDLFWDNTGKTVSSIAIDPQGTGAYQTVTLNTPFNLTYATKGFYKVNIRVTYSDASIRYSHTKLAVHDSPAASARFGGPAVTEQVTNTKAYLGKANNCEITVELSAQNNTGAIRKPLIVVEGFDPTGTFDYTALTNQLSYDYNSNTYIDLNYGLDDLQGYDMIFVNWKDGTDYIQRNAYALEAAIQLVNSRKTTYNGVRQQNVIVGMSMGGLVTRYALKDMEANNIAHETRLFISHDAPHWGANVPVAAQMAVQHLSKWKLINIDGLFQTISWVDFFPVSDAAAMFDSPAAKQMLIQRYSLSGQSANSDNSVHDAFMNEINQLGWPTKCRNVAMSNGSCTGTPLFNGGTMLTISGNRSMSYFGALWKSLALSIFGGTANGAGLVMGWGNTQPSPLSTVWEFPLSLFSTKSSINIDFRLNAVPSSGSTEIYRGNIYSQKKILGLINVNNYFSKCQVNSSPDMLPLDNAPGGVYDMEQFGFDPSTLLSNIPDFFAGYINSAVVQNKFCFIPVGSALAFSNPQTTLFTNVCSDLNCRINPAISTCYVPQQNQLHISYTQDNGNWILQEQSPTSNCTMTCSTRSAILGANAICQTETYSVNNTGATVTWSASPTGILSLAPNGNKVVITRLMQGGDNVILSAAISNACSGPVTITKSIVAGVPNPPNSILINSGATPTSLCPNTRYVAAALPAKYTEHMWQFPSGFQADWVTTNDYEVGFVTSSSGSGDIYVSRTNACGLSDPVILYASITDWNCQSLRFSITPNPASNKMTISAPEIAGQTVTPDASSLLARSSAPDKSNSIAFRPVLKIQRVQVYSVTGALELSRTFDNTNTANLDISSLPPGVHFVHVFDGRKTYTQKIVVQR